VSAQSTLACATTRQRMLWRGWRTRRPCRAVSPTTAARLFPATSFWPIPAISPTAAATLPRRLPTALLPSLGVGDAAGSAAFAWRDEWRLPICRSAVCASCADRWRTPSTGARVSVCRWWRHRHQRQDQRHAVDRRQPPALLRDHRHAGRRFARSVGRHRLHDARGDDTDALPGGFCRCGKHRRVRSKPVRSASPKDASTALALTSRCSPI
jgi:hypothetical protein